MGLRGTTGVAEISSHSWKMAFQASQVERVLAVLKRQKMADVKRKPLI